ncbi:MAG: TonB-dependent receptor [Steroidobacteraceae bacterium]
MLDRNRFWLGAGNALALAMVLTSTSADAQSSSSTKSGTGGVEEVVVSAQRVRQNLQDVPIAVTAITAESAGMLGIKDPTTLAEAVPGLTMNRASTSSLPFIRGVGSPSSTVGNEPSVATYVDDVYLINAATSFFEFNNIEQVEVLKGPQGTLFGRNATGGVIHIHTRDPSFEPSMDVAASVGNFQTYTGQFYGTVGLSDTVAVNLAARLKNQDDGWGENLTSGEDVYTEESGGFRAKLLYKPSDETSVLLTGSYDDVKGNQGLAGRPAPGTFGLGGFDPSNLGFWDYSTNYDNNLENKLQQGSAKIRHEFDAFTLVSISAYSKIEIDQNQDTDATPLRFFDAFIDMSAKTFTQEFQLLSPQDSKLRWLAGVFYLHDKSIYDADYLGLQFGAAGAAGQFGKQKSDSYSGFAEVTAEVLQKTNLTVGARYTRDKREFTGSSTFGPASFGPYPDEETFSKVSGRVSLDYRFTDDLMAYVAYNRGFKSGIFNLTGVAPGARVGPPAVDPEQIDAYTAGIKSEWLDNRLRVNAEAYYYDYKDIQVQTTQGGSAFITNAGAATIKGFDVTITAEPIDALTVSAAFAVNDGEYDEFPGGPKFFPTPPNAPVDPPPGGCTPPVPPYPARVGLPTTAQRVCNLAGLDTIHTQPFSANLSVIYRMDLGAIPTDLAVSWLHSDSYFFDADNNPDVEQPDYDLLNASIRLSFADEKYALRLWGNNLTEEKYYSFLQQSTNASTKYSPQAPRTYGLTLEAHF